jgi:triacylglycerol lipase
MPRDSRLARLLQLTLALEIAIALGWLAWRWPHGGIQAVVGALLVVFLGPLVLAIEFLFSALANRHDPGLPRAGPMQYVAAWLAESSHMVRAFAWRQPFLWRAVADHLAPEAAGRTGLVFVHGFLCNRGFWTGWMRRMRASGRACVAVNLEPVFGSIEQYAPLIDQAVAQVRAATGLAPVLVCHSMGGLAARAWWRASGGAQPLAALVTIASPHAGTWMGRFSLHVNGRQMCVGSEWLRQLAQHEAVHPLPPAICWYSNCDNMVFPASTATLPGADNRLLPGQPHVALAFRPEVVEGTLGILDQIDTSASR